jgi:hypothetical protein
MEKRTRKIAEAIYEKFLLTKLDSLPANVIKNIINRFFSHSKTREQYFNLLIERGFLEALDLEKTKFIVKNPSTIKDVSIDDFIESLRTQRKDLEAKKEVEKQQ